MQRSSLGMSALSGDDRRELQHTLSGSGGAAFDDEANLPTGATGATEIRI